MGFIKKKKERPMWIAKAYMAFVVPFVQKLNNLLRFSGRIRLANQWARHHPKRLMSLYAVIAVILLVVNLIPNGNHKQQSFDDLGFSSLQNVGLTFDRLKDYEIRQEQIRSEIGKLGQSSLNIVNEIDSLMALQDKSRSDSIRIFDLYSILDKNLNNNTNDRPKEN